jgi:hypothetical protein
MSDSTGVFQHAIFTIPRFEDGYCTDDNARALLLTVMLPEQEHTDHFIRSLQSATAAFLQHAFVNETGRFRNFMAFNRNWSESEGSEDSHGRALWALGAVVGRTSNPGLRSWAASLFEEALAPVVAFTSPRAWAFSLLGLNEYFRTLHGDLMVDRLRWELSGKLFALFQKNATSDWMWAEDIVAYDNPRLAQALIIGGRWTKDQEMEKMGLNALHWLMKNQSLPNGCFRPVGSNGFWLRGGDAAAFDQQPLEAGAAVSACFEAFHATRDPFWKTEARRSFDWFLGSNALRLPVYDATTGGCRDGLHENRVNRNQGAESTLSFLIALAEMRSNSTHRSQK